MKQVDPGSAEFIAAIRTSELGARIAADIDAQRLADRKQLADELASINVDAEKSYPKAVAACEKAAVEIRKLEEALRVARIKFAQAAGTRTELSVNYTRRRAELENELAETASPLISEFISWARADIECTRKKFRSRYWVDRNPITGKTVDKCETNAAGVNARLSALGEAISAASDMALVADQSSVSETLRKMKDDLPEVAE